MNGMSSAAVISLRSAAVDKAMEEDEVYALSLVETHEHTVHAAADQPGGQRFKTRTLLVGDQEIHTARAVPLKFAAGSYVHFPPVIAGFVGADHTAALLAGDSAGGRGVTSAEKRDQRSFDPRRLMLV